MVSPEVDQYGLAPWPLMIVPIPFLVAAVIALSLRLWVRCFMTHSFGWDDGCLIASFMGWAGECALLIIVGHIQLTQGITGPALLLGKLNFGGVAAYIFSQILFKLSLAVFFLRFLFQKWQRWTIFITVAVFIAYSIALLFVTMFECGDPSSPNLANATCYDWATLLGPINYFGAVLNALVDWAFALSPILVIQTLSINRRGKRSVMALILLAVSGSIISIARIPYVDGLNPSISFYSKSSNRIAYLSVAEGGVGIIAVSLATLRPLFRQWLQKTRASSDPSSDKDYIREPQNVSWSAHKLPDYPNVRQFSHIIEDVELDDRNRSQSTVHLSDVHQDTKSSHTSTLGYGRTAQKFRRGPDIVMIPAK